MTDQALEGGLGIINDGVKSPNNLNSPPKTPSNEALSPPIASNKVKVESPIDSRSPTPKSSPSPSSVPGAEVKGKPGTPIPSSSKPGTPGTCTVTTAEDNPKVAGTVAGGRLTFYRGNIFVYLSKISKLE